MYNKSIIKKYKYFALQSIIFLFFFFPISNIGAEEIWHLEKNILGLTCEDLNDDNLKEIITVGPAGEMCVYNHDGTLSQCISITPQISHIYTAHLNAEPKFEFIGFTPWFSGVHAIDAKGQELWQYNDKNINDIEVVDLNNDGLDEVVVGHNNSEGVVLLNCRGEVIWQNGLLTHITHIASGDINLDGYKEILLTSGMGKLHVLNAHGVEIDRYSFKDMEVSFVDVLEVFSDSDGPEIVISGRGRSKARGQAILSILTRDFVPFWKVKLGPTALFDSTIANSTAGLPDRKWLAVGADNGTVRVYDRFSELIFMREDVGRNDGCVRWIRDMSDNPILVCAGRDLGLYAYMIDEELIDMGEPEIVNPPGFVERAQKTGMALNYPLYLLKIGYFCIVVALMLLVFFKWILRKRKGHLDK